MAVSNSTVFSRTANELITDALELLGVKAEEEPLQNVELVRGIKWLNYLLKAWQTDGVMAWTLTEGSFALTQGDHDVVFGPAGTVTAVPLDIQDMRINRGGNDLQMTRLSRDAYFSLPNKTTQGYPTQYFYDRQRDTGTLYLWPAPDSAGGTVSFTYRRRIMDITNSTDDFDIPQEWSLAMVTGLAALLIPIYGKSGTPRGQEIKEMAAQAYESVKAFDIDEGESSMFVYPASYDGAR